MALDLNDYPGLTMAEITNKLVNNQFLSDVQFLVGDERIYAHSFMLMLRSTVFQNQLTGTTNDQKLIPIDYVDYDSCYQFVRFIYNDQCNVTANNLIDLFTLAKRYKVIELENLIINNQIYADKLFEQCLMENDQILIQKLISLGHLKQYLLTDRFLSLSSDLIERILKLEYTNISELELFEALMRWINKNAENNYIGTSLISMRYQKLLHLIRLSAMTIEQFTICMNKHPHLFSDSECLLLLKGPTRLANTENFPWNVKQRSNFKLDVQNCKIKYQLYSNETMFSVSREMLFIGLWYGNAVPPASNCKNVQIRVTFYQANEEMFTITRANEGYNNTVVLNLGESIKLQPNINYTCTISYMALDGDKIQEIYYQLDKNICSIIDSNLIKSRRVGIGMFGMFFKLPKD